MFPRSCVHYLCSTSRLPPKCNHDVTMTKPTPPSHRLRDRGALVVIAVAVATWFAVAVSSRADGAGPGVGATADDDSTMAPVPTAPTAPDVPAKIIPAPRMPLPPMPLPVVSPLAKDPVVADPLGVTASSLASNRSADGSDDARRNGAAGEVIYPPQRLPMTFTHARHLERGMACIDCHVTALSSTSAVDRLVPTEAVCTRCHAIDRKQTAGLMSSAPTGACVTCHLGFSTAVPVDRVDIPSPSLKFSHAAHAKTTCISCHGDLRAQGVGLATRAQLPKMASCMTCHDDKTASAACTLCHLADVGGRVRTQLPDGALIPQGDEFTEAHDPDFLRRHSIAARERGASCQSCHAQEFCADCHVGITKPDSFHPGNYQLTHAVDARRGIPDCSGCHRTQTFCVTCHDRTGVTTRGDGQFEANNPGHAFHPAGWSTVIGGPNLHATEARRNITTCTSCHREDFCTTCHSAQPGAGKISPHPPGWRSSTRCRALDSHDRRMCLRCHVAANEVGCDWTARN